jgi:hypothetical protein
LLESLDLLGKIDDTPDRIKAQAELCTYLGAEQRAQSAEEILTIMHEVEWADSFACDFSDLVSHISVPFRGRAYEELLKAVRDIDSPTVDWPKARIEVLAKLTSYLPGPESRRALQGLIAETPRGEALTRLVSHLPDRLLAEALAAISEIQDDRWRAAALMGLLPRLPEESLQEVMGRVSQIEDKEARANVLTDLALRLRETKYFDQALTAVKEIQDTEAQGELLIELSPQLPTELLQEAQEMALKINSIPARAEVLGELGWRLPESRRLQVVKETVDKIRQTLVNRTDLADQSRALEHLIPHLSLPDRISVIHEVLEAAQKTDSPDTQAEVLYPIAHQLPEECVSPALELLKESRLAHLAMFPEEAGRPGPHLLIQYELTRHLVEAGHFQQALKVMEGTEYGLPFSVPARLVGKMPEEFLLSALALARIKLEDSERIDARPLLHLSLCVPPVERFPVLQETLLAATKMESGYGRRRALRGSSYQLASLLRLEAPDSFHRTALGRLWLRECQDTSLLHALARGTRTQLLDDLSSLGHLVSALGGEEAITEIIRAIQDVGRWWP